MSFQDASVIITGGSKGIGLSIAMVFARSTNRRLVLISRSLEDLQKARQECIEEGAKGVEILAADVTDSNALAALDFGLLNPGILINNAGSFLFKPLEETSEEEFSRQFEINTKGAFTVTSQLLPVFKTQERALIVNICSQASLKGYGHSGAYTMSKHALLGYTRSLRKELMGTGIAVTAINLGQTFSTSWDGVDVDPNKLIDPEDVGKLILSLSELSSRSVVEEILLMPDGGETDPM
ncbi:MAG: SDR family oxidoreductase [bacterium]|nr:SDR family oxidoreductase [bacterium]